MAGRRNIGQPFYLLNRAISHAGGDTKSGSNARLYSPYLGRFVSPDPLLNSEGSAWDYNPYVYARNNPYKYMDRNGEFPWLIVSAAVFGGWGLVCANYNHIYNVGSFFKSFSIGAVANVAATGLSIGVGVYVGAFVTAGVGALGVSVGSPVIAGAAPFVGAAAGAAAGNLTYNLSYSALTGTPFNFSWRDLGIDMGIAVATVGAGVIASKLAPKVSKIMQTRHRPKVTNPDEMAAMAKADKALLPTKEYVRPETAMWEIDCPAELPVMTLKDNNTVNILRPEIQGYKECVSKTDLHHSFPRIFDKFVVKYGEMRIIPTENTASYVYPGKCYGEPGYSQVNINTNDGEVYHRFFWKASQRSRIYVGHGENKVYFYK